MSNEITPLDPELFPESRPTAGTSYKVLADPSKGRVFVQFSDPIPGMVLTYEQAMAMSDALTKQAFALRGISS